MSASHQSPQASIAALRSQLAAAQVQLPDRSAVSTALPALDQLLPDDGLPGAGIVEWVSDSPGIHGTSLAIQCAARFLKQPGAFAVLDSNHTFHPASLPWLGIPMARVLVVRPQIVADLSGQTGQQALRRDTLWSLEQLARCAGIRVLLTWIDRISSTAQRRLQLAVERSGVAVFLMRPATALRQTSWASLRIRVQTTNRSSIRVRLIRSKNAITHDGYVELGIDHETGHVFEVSKLPNSTTSNNEWRPGHSLTKARRG